MGFCLITIASQLAVRVVHGWAMAAPDRVLEDVAMFLVLKASELIRLMFAALSGRYIVNLFQSSKHNSGYVLFIAVSAVVLLKLADHAIKREARVREARAREARAREE